MAKLSVIVCVYNTKEDMLAACLASVCASTFRDIELVVVNDGSTVDYSSILKDVNLPLVYHKTENRGTLAARLTGIELATSPLVCFVDSDDTVSFNYFEGLVAKQTQTKADIVIGDWAFETSKVKYYCTNDSTINSTFTIVGNNVLPLFFAQRGYEHAYYVLWNKVFTRGTLARAAKKILGLSLTKMCFAEDVLIAYFAFSAAKKVSNTHVGYYFYHMHEGQEIHKIGEQNLIEQAKAMTTVFDSIKTDLKLNKKFDAVEKDFDAWKHLLFATQITTAKRQGYSGACESLLELYGEKRIAKMPKGASKAYDGQKILPANIAQIDKELANIYTLSQKKAVFAKAHSYSARQIEVLSKNFGKNNIILAKNKNEADIVLPKEILPLRLRFVHHPAIFKLGLFLFPKGSKIRRYLKSKL